MTAKPARETPTDAPAVGPAHSVAYLRLMVASVLCMAMFGAVQVIPPVSLDAMGEDLGLNLEQRGSLLGIRMAALVASLLVVGACGERRGRQHVLFWGLLAIAAGQLLGARSCAYAPLLASMVVSGLGFGIVEALVNPLIAQLNPQHSARALNVLNGLYSLGLVLGAFTTGEVLQAGASWRVPFLLWALPPVVCAALYLTPRYPAPVTDPDLAPLRGWPVRAFVSLPLFWALMVAMFLGGGCEAGLTSWAPNYMSDVLEASARGGAWATIFYGAAMAAGRFASGALVTRMSPVRLMLHSGVWCMLATAGLAFIHTQWAGWVLFALGGLFVACYWPTLLSVASDHIATGATSLFSLLAAAGVSGCVVVPWAIGALGDLVGLRAAMLVLPGTMVLLLAILVWIGRMTHRGPLSP